MTRSAICGIGVLFLSLAVVPSIAAQSERAELLLQAIDAVSQPVVEQGQSVPHRHQVMLRFDEIPTSYYFQSEDRDHWSKLLQDEDADIYARLCAASLLYHDSDEARNFVDMQLQHESFRYRNNAAVALAAAARGRDCPAYKRTLELIQSKSLEELPPASQSMNPKSRNVDNRDIQPPVAQLCWVIALFKDDAVSPLLEETFQRLKDSHHDAQHVALALARFDKKKASACLLNLLGSDNVINDCGTVFYLGTLGNKEVVPKLCELLTTVQHGDAASTANMFNQYLLQALKTLHDPIAIREIESFLKGPESDGVEQYALKALESLKDDERRQNILDKLDSRIENSERVAGIALELAAWKDMAVLPALDDIARKSKYDQDRAVAIMSLGMIGDSDAIYLLAKLLEVDFPPDLISSNQNPENDIDRNLKHEIVRNLRALTNHNYGLDSQKWVNHALKLSQ